MSARPRLSIFGVIGEALGFATGRFSTAVRIAWLPLLLLLTLEVAAIKLGVTGAVQSIATALRLEPGYTFKFLDALTSASWWAVAVMGLALILQASIQVPLIRLASIGEVPGRGSMYLRFGAVHLRYVLACSVSFALIVFAVRAAIQFVLPAIQSLLGSKAMMFDEGGLHGVTTVEVYSDVNGVIAYLDAFLGRIGIPTGTVDLLVLIPMLLIGGYIGLRLFAFPYLVAAYRTGAQPSLSAAWRLSGGWNLFPILGILAVYVLIHVLTFGMVFVAFEIFKFAVVGSEIAIRGLEGLYGEEGTIAPVLRGTLAVISSGILLGAATFLAALNAGLGGALVHRARGGA